MWIYIEIPDATTVKHISEKDYDISSSISYLSLCDIFAGQARLLFEFYLTGTMVNT